jgi:hypothetical protein
VLTDVAGFTFTNDTIRANTIRGNATTYAILATRAVDCTWTTPTIIQGAMNFTTCTRINVTNTIYCEAVSGTTVTTYAGQVWNLSSNTIDSTFSGLTMPVTNTQPYTSLLAIATGCSGIKLRNIGTRVAPMTMGSTNGCGLIYTVLTGCYDVKIQRVYVSNTRTGIMTGDNSSTRITEENVWGDYADAVDVMAVLNHTQKGMGGTGALTSQISVYGTHWRDSFTSTTAGRIAILMNEPTSLTTSQVTLANGSAFTSAGGLYMPVIGHDVLFETPDFLIGHTGFSNTALVMAGGTATNYGYKYQINKNDGGGWSAESATLTATTLGTTLNGLTGINALLGFKLRLRITTSTTNATAITSVYLTTTSTTTAQDYQYPLDQTTTVFSANTTLIGSEVRIYDLDNSPNGSLGTELSGTESNASATYSYTGTAGNSIWIQIMKTGYIEFGQQIVIPTINTTIDIILTKDNNI